MSAQDRRAEREVADFYDDTVRPADEPQGPLWPRVKRFSGAFADGYVLAVVARKLLGR